MTKINKLFICLMIIIFFGESIYILLTYSNVLELKPKININLHVEKAKLKDSNLDLNVQLDIHTKNRPKNGITSCGIYAFTQNPLFEDIDIINVYFYLDDRYPSTIEPDAWMRLRSYLRYWLPSKYLNFYEVDASELAEIMKKNTKGIVIIPNGIVPYTIYNGSSFPNNLLNKWVMAGGIGIFAGDGIGALIGYENKMIKEISMAQNKIFGYSIGMVKYIPYDYENFPFIAYQDSNITSILNIQYRNPPFSPLWNYIKYYGGFNIGYTSRIQKDILSSCSLIRVGNGTIILFGGGFNSGEGRTNEKFSAFDVACDIQSLIESRMVFIQRPSLLEYGEIASLVPKPPETSIVGGVTNYTIQYERKSGAVSMNMNCSSLGQIAIKLPMRKSYAITIFDYPKVPSALGLQIKYKKGEHIKTCYLAIYPEYFANETLYVSPTSPEDIIVKLPSHYVYTFNISDMMSFIDFNYSDVEEISFRLATDREYSSIKFGIYDVNSISSFVVPE